MLPFLVIIAINIIGYFLKSFGLDRYIIFLGFRFHLATSLPIILFFNKKILDIIKEYFKKFNFTRGYYTLFILFLSLIVFPVIIYFMGLSKYSDPDYLYELGASSIIDYPIYLIWNLPQLLIFSAFLLYTANKKKPKFIIILITSILPFIYEFVPINGNEIVLWNIYILVLAALLLSICLLRLNIYLSSIVIFTILWGNILAFGSFSSILLNLLLAKNYNSWEGVFIPDKLIGSYILFIQLGISIILFLPTLLLNSGKKKKNNNDISISEPQLKINN